MDTWRVTAGIRAEYRVTIRDELGEVIRTYNGTESLAGSIRAGRSLAPLATLQPYWADYAAGLVGVPIPGEATEALAPGSYRVQVKLADDSADFYEGMLEVGYGPGTDVLPAVYCSYEDMLDYCSWIEKLQTSRDLTGFAKQRGRARSRLDDILVASFKYSAMGIQAGQPGFMPSMMFAGYQNSPPNAWLREELDNDALKITDQVKEITAKWAIGFVCSPQLSRLEEAEIRMAGAMTRDADSLVRLLRAEIVTGRAGLGPPGLYEWGSVIIHCGSTSLR